MLQRDKIVRRDFPTDQRGYDPAAVDAHLEELAAELERDQGEPDAAEPMSGYVRSIVEAAERSGATIREAADEAAAAKQAETTSQAQETLRDANAEAADHIGFVTERTTAMRERLDAVGGEVQGLVEAVRAGAGRLEEDLTALEERVGELAGTARSAGQDGARAGAPAPQAGEFGLAEPGGDERTATDADAAPDTPAGEEPTGDDTVEGARLIALNMALSGASREATDRYMAENFDLPDRAKLLEEVYGSVER
jgi:DivIVA domain-containing protein